jgi:hypothetical protein
MTVKVNITHVEEGQYRFERQLAPQPTAPADQNGNGKPAQPSKIVPQTSSVLAPGLARRVRV